MRASKNIGAIFLKKKRRLRQRTHKLRASRNMGAIFLKKKAPAATYPQIKGFQIYGGHFPTPLTPKRHGSTKFHKKVKNLLELAKTRALSQTYPGIFGGTNLVRWRHPPGGRGPSEIVLVRTISEKGR